MKFKHAVIGIIASTLTIGAFLVSFPLKAKNIESKAENVVYSRIYYVGTENNWRSPDQDMTGFTFHYVGSKTVDSKTSHYYQLTLNISKGSIFKLRDWEDGHNVDWMNYYDSSKVLQSLVDDGSNDHNLKCTMTGNYTITYRYTNQNDKSIEGFELNNANQMYYVASNTTWAASNKIYLHAWGTSDLTDWSSSCLVNKVSTIKFGTNSLQFYSFKVPTSATKFLIKHYDGDTDYKTGDLTPSNGACFDSSSSSSSNNSKAGEVIGRIYSGLGTATYAGTTYENSICAIGSSERTTILSKYTSLSSGAKSVVDSSTLTTYDPNNLSTTTNVSFTILIDRLSKNTSAGYPVNAILKMNDNATSTIVVVTSLISVCALGAFFFLKKKKENN